MSEHVCIQIFQECTGEHSHPYPQILVPLQETMRIRAEETEYEVKLQELFFVPPGMNHRCNYRGRLLVLNLPLEVLDNREVAALCYPTVVSMHGQITQLVELIQSELRQNPDSKSVRHLCEAIGMTSAAIGLYRCRAGGRAPDRAVLKER